MGSKKRLAKIRWIEILETQASRCAMVGLPLRQMTEFGRRQSPNVIGLGKGFVAIDALGAVLVSLLVLLHPVEALARIEPIRCHPAIEL